MATGPNTAWAGQIGSVALRVEVPHAGRIEAEWEIDRARRHKVSSSIEEFERSVLLQVMMSGGLPIPGSETRSCKRSSKPRPNGPLGPPIPPPRNAGSRSSAGTAAPGGRIVVERVSRWP